MSFTVLIPARLASSRLPNKVLAVIDKVPMIVRVAQRALRSSAKRVCVAADSPEIIEVCESYGVSALLTRTDHASGSDRLAQACDMLGLADDEHVINVQGDEPLIEPMLIDAVAHALKQHADCAMSTAACPLSQWASFVDPNVVKVVLDAQSKALYFSRSPIPAARNFNQHAWWEDAHANALPKPLRHIGIYGYRASFLRLFPTLPQAPLEQLEMLEQLRALWHGYRIAVHVTDQEPGPSVDTAEDLERVRALLAQVPEKPGKGACYPREKAAPG